MTDTDVGPDEVVVEWTAPPEIEEAARSTQRLRERAAQMAAEANARTVMTVRQLHDQGFSARDAGSLVGVSFQYAARVIKDGRLALVADQAKSNRGGNARTTTHAQAAKTRSRSVHHAVKNTPALLAQVAQAG